MRELTTDERHPHSHSLRLFASPHTPYNKRPWEVANGRAILEVTDYDGKATNPEAWTEIQLREIEADKRGQDRSKVITITLRGDERSALIKLLSRGTP